MGYAYYEFTTPLGRPMKRGYAILCKCHQRGCTEKIDRGLSFLCYCCTWYFCGKHLTFGYDQNDNAVEFDCFAGGSSQCCYKCAKEVDKV